VFLRGSLRRCTGSKGLCNEFYKSAWVGGSWSVMGDCKTL